PTLHLHTFPTRRSSDLISRKARGKVKWNSPQRTGPPGSMTLNRDCGSTCHVSPARVPSGASTNRSPTVQPSGRTAPKAERSATRSEEHTSELQSRRDLV